MLRGRISYETPYTLNSPQHGTVECQMRVVCSYLKGFKDQHGVRYIVYVVHQVRVTLHQLHDYYR
ncbi:hypothetical protein [Phormidesmis priestleyi]